MPAFCKSCGASIEPNIKFCRECGTRVTNSEAETRTKPSETQGPATEVPATKSFALLWGTIGFLGVIIIATVFFLRRTSIVTTRTVIVPGDTEGIDTGIYLNAGDKIEVSASGNVIMGAGWPPMPPEGRQPNCEGRVGFPAADLPCWSLIGRIGPQGPIFYVGRAITFQAATSGKFFLGVNDDNLQDNSGSWTATIVVTSTTPVTTGPSSSNVHPQTPPTHVSPVLDQGPPVVIKASIEGGTGIQLPPGRFYVYGYATGGAAPSDRFASGHYTQVVDTAGQQSAALAFGTSNQNSYSTQTGYHVIGGVSIGGVLDNFTPFYGANAAAGANSAQADFVVPSNSLVVVIALASSQQQVTVAGIPGFQVDETSSSEGMLIGHAYLDAGAYSAIERSGALAGGQDAQNMADLIGVFVFSAKK